MFDLKSNQNKQLAMVDLFRGTHKFCLNQEYLQFDATNPHNNRGNFHSTVIAKVNLTITPGKTAQRQVFNFLKVLSLLFSFSLSVLPLDQHLHLNCILMPLATQSASMKQGAARATRLTGWGTVYKAFDLVLGAH